MSFVFQKNCFISYNLPSLLAESSYPFNVHMSDSDDLLSLVLEFGSSIFLASLEVVSIIDILKESACDSIDFSVLYSQFQIHCFIF